MKLNSKSNSHASSDKKDHWNDYYNFALKSGVTKKDARFYVHWARKYFEYIKMPLRNCSAENVKDFLDHLSGMMDAWQVEQARDALRLLFRDFLKVSWIKSHSPARREGIPVCPLPSDRERMPVGAIYPEGHRHELLLQSALLSAEQIFKKLQTEIRYLHYSIRTEQTYVQWVQRFMSFHKMKPVENLSAADVKTYLEHLAVQRKVSASTQNQALLKAISDQLSAFS